MSAGDFTLFEELMKEGKKLAAEGKLYESLSKFQHARKIQETPKVVQRIQKLKDFISQHKTSKSKLSSENESGDSFCKSTNSFKEHATESTIPIHKDKLKNSEIHFMSQSAFSSSAALYENEVRDSLYKGTNSFKEPARPKAPGYKDKLQKSESHSTSESFSNTSTVLNEIQNVKMMKHTPSKIPTSTEDLSPEQVMQFNKLKRKAMGFSYDGKFEVALEVFQQALKLCDCPVIKKYINDIKAVLGKHSNELQEFKKLTDTGKKLAVEGKAAKSLEKLRDALDICPSPKVSKIVKHIQENVNSTPRKLFNEDSSYFVTPKTKLSQSDKSNKSEELYSEDFVNPIEKLPTDPKSLSPCSFSKFKDLYSKARLNASEGKLKDALKYLKEACLICRTDKAVKRIKELQEHIKSSVEVDDDNQMVAVAEGFCIFHEIYEKLYPYQRLGVAWMYGLFKKHKGGVLGDDMGLGKTFQVIAFLSGLIDADLVKHILIIMPVSLLTNWENEFKKWCPGIKVCLFHGTSKKERERNALRVQRKGHVLLTSYGMVVNNLDFLNHSEGNRFIWDYVILDEGHKIKNPTKTTKAVHEVPAKNRLVLTGTPIQNNLRELWALYDFVHQGALLGSMKTFKMQYENTITRAREKDATVGEKRLGTEMAENLKKLIQPYFLRRNKEEIWGNNNGDSQIQDIECKMADLKLSESKVSTRKNDLIVWLPMSEQQCEIYRSFLHSEAVKTILVSKRSPLVELTTLKKICDHPRLLSQRACLQLGLNGKIEEEDLMRELDDESKTASSIENVSDETLIEESEKMKFLISLLENLKQNGHRTLIFSLSRKILDMIHRILTNRQWKVIRIDGTISKMEERERRIQMFQKNPSYPVFLLTTQVGGVGITLTAADRVIIYDPSWNPATDSQAVDRAYRIGQKKDVVVYRLMTCGTVEEKIYRRQIFKDSITRQATGQADPYRYFSKQELRELFVLEDSNYSATQVQLSQMHSGERKTDTSLDEHIAFLHSLNIFGISDHDLMFSKNIKDDTEDNDESAISHDYIKKQVAVAQQLIQAEAAVVEDGLRLAGDYTRPYLETIPNFKKNTEKDLYKPPMIPVIDLTALSPQTKYTDSKNDPRRSDDSDISVFSPTDSVTSKSEKGILHSPAMASNIRPTREALNLEKKKITDYYSLSGEVQMIPNLNESKNISINEYSFTQNASNIPITIQEQSSYHQNKNESIKSSPIQMKAVSEESKEDGYLPQSESQQKYVELNSSVNIESDETKIDSVSSFSRPSMQSNISTEILKKLSMSADKKSDECLSESNLNIQDHSLPLNSMEDEKTIEGNNLRLSMGSIITKNVLGALEASVTNISVGVERDKSIISNSQLAESKSNASQLIRSPYSNSSEFSEGSNPMLQSSINDAENEEFVRIEEISPVESNVNEKNEVHFNCSEDNSRAGDDDNNLSGEDPFTYSPVKHSSFKNSSQVNFPVNRLSFSTSPEFSEHSTSRLHHSSVKEEDLVLSEEMGPAESLKTVVNKTQLINITSNSKTETEDNFSERNILAQSPAIEISHLKPDKIHSEPLSSTENDLKVLKTLNVTDERETSYLAYRDSKPQRASCSPFDSPTKVFTSKEQRASSPMPEREPHIESDLKMFLNESLGELSFNNDKPLPSLTKNRKSCARLTQFLSESDTSQQGSCSSSANTSQERIVVESDEDSDEYDDKNSVASISLNESLSFVPNSIPSTPLVKIPTNNTVGSPVSPRRITPLRLHKGFSSPNNSPFAKALATSPLIQVNKLDTTLVEPNLSDNNDSPLITAKRKLINKIVSDSETSDEEADQSFHQSKFSNCDEIQNLGDSSDESDLFQTPLSRPNSLGRSRLLSRICDESYSDSDEY